MFLGYDSLKIIVNELDTSLQGGIIRKIFQPLSDTIILNIYSKTGNFNLLISSHPRYSRIHLTKENLPNPSFPPPFCQILRKYLQNSKVIKVSIDELLPAISIDFIKGEDIYILQCEITGQFSNILLLDKENKIIYPLKKFTSKFREVAPYKEYIKPRVNEKLFNKGVPLEFFYNYKNNINEIKEPFTFNILLDLFYNEYIKKEEINRLRKELISNFEKEKKKLITYKEKLYNEISIASQFEAFKIKGDLISCNLDKIRKGEKRVKLVNYYDPDLKEIEIELEPSLTPLENAEIFYKKYKKLKGKEEKIKEAILKIEKKINFIDENVRFIENASYNELYEYKKNDKLQGVTKKAGLNSEKKDYREFIIGKWRILVGKDAHKNDKLVTHIGRPYEFWLHVRDYPGSHVILRGPDKESIPSREILLIGAQLAAYYSKGNKNSKIEVIYTRLKNVFKKKGSPVGAVFCKEFKSIFVIPKKPDDFLEEDF